VVPVQAMGNRGLAPLILNLKARISGQFHNPVAVRDILVRIQFLAGWIPGAVSMSNTNVMVTLYHKLIQVSVLSCGPFEMMTLGN